MLQHLVRVHDIETIRGKFECVHVTDDKLDIAAAGALGFRAGECRGILRRFQRRHAARRDSLREVDRDGSRTAPDVQQSLTGTELRQQVGSRVFGRTRAV